MSKNRYKSLAAVFAIILKDEQVLLQKRVNTGYKDGFYDLGTSGHLEENESLKEAMQRELSEELGLSVPLENIQYSSMIHKNDNETGLVYINVYFIITDFTGEPHIMEPEKNAELKWVSLNNLPENLIEDRKIALTNMSEGKAYMELGWNDEK